MTTSTIANNTPPIETGNDIQVEEGTLGKLVMARLKPNQDLTESVEALCLQHGMQRAIVRGAIGSLVDARLQYAGHDGARQMEVNGPGVEILNVFGEIGFGDARSNPHPLQGVVADTDGKIFAGRFVRGANLSFITIEITLQEWIPAGAAPARVEQAVAA
ncbi:PPC domain-containing DNA-binding protein [Herbaspirillum sp. YR522]|uniref:PPC domain-containing DNA-binding protein n=1 Tax=Herbaspirillum sp. YR522 TaxID=1144342 RepID=UPI00026FBBE4|nr:PPC domain-containing DNA-binding protein [Herbaspirillum sp. YR522]EJN08753.1 putative DNA-binding protein with PD1-like DNA-binding motif [Herbaspirillum sp. YR522]